jgi:hypothetical protein
MFLERRTLARRGMGAFARRGPLFDVLDHDQGVSAEDA